MDSFARKAISAALNNNWSQAIKLNHSILESNPADIEALSRSAFAYTQLGELEKAKKAYRKILSLDRYNYIALKNLDKINSLGKNKSKSPLNLEVNRLSPALFLEEPGKTKNISLKNVAPTRILTTLRNGDTVYLYPKKHTVELRSDEKTYIGALPDDLSFRLIRLLKAGYIYHVCIKNTQKNAVGVFIRESKRGARYKNQPSFPILGDKPKETVKKIQPLEDDSLE